MTGTIVEAVFEDHDGTLSVGYVRRGVAVNCSVVEVGKDGKGVFGTDVDSILARKTLRAG